jgi:hypothetical protein
MNGVVDVTAPVVLNAVTNPVQIGEMKKAKKNMTTNASPIFL